jgi:Heterokaryon incompatibility protein (HET)
MPKRLVKIDRTESGEWNISLLEAQGDEIHPYVALSYCWGGEQPHKTTKANIKHYGDSILPSDVSHDAYLPSTIRDAISITLELGFSHLWIDSFCICQDDEEDKLIEISLMPSIYRNAVVTIAAANSSGVNKGFLHPRKVTEDPSAIFQLRWRDSGDKSYYPIHQSRPPSDIPLSHVILMRKPQNVDVEEPLDSRAWAMQERILAPRVLEYGTHRLRWICPSTEFEFDQTDGWTARRLHTDVIRNMRTGWKDDGLEPGTRPLPIDHISAQSSTSQKAAEVAPHPEGMTAEQLKSATTKWHQIVAHYTGRALKLKTDRILAMSGIAETFNTTYPGTYAAGLWLFHLPGGLLWKPEMPWKQAKRGKAQLYPPKKLRPRVYQGPSWSWVGVNGSITFEDCLYACQQGVRPKLETSSIEMDLVDARARYGAVRRSSIICHVRVRSALWFNELFDNSESGGPAQLLLLDARAENSEDLCVGIEADCLEEAFVDVQDGSISISVLLIEVLELDVQRDIFPAMPGDDEFLDALLENAFAPFAGKGPRTFSDFLTPARHQQIMAAQELKQSRKPTEWQTRGLVLEGLADGTFSRVGTFKHQWGVPATPGKGNLRVLARAQPSPSRCCAHGSDLEKNSNATEDQYLPASVHSTGSESLFAGLAKVELTIV